MFGLKFLALMLVGLLLCLCVLPSVSECEAANAAASDQYESPEICILTDFRTLQRLRGIRPFRWLRSCSLNESPTLLETQSSECERYSEDRRGLQFERLVERENR